MSKKIINNRFVSMIVVAALFVAALMAVNAIVPLGPSTFTRGGDEKQDELAYPAGNTTAYAGNITQLTIHGITQTKHWQGYYGDVTGTIVLDDASNFTLYDWPNDEPKGEIYATVTVATPLWYTLACFDYNAGNGTVATPDMNNTYWEDFYNFTYNDVDGIDETFNITEHLAIDVGDAVTITADSCPSTYMHTNDTFQESDLTDKWSEVLLQDDAGQLIFVAIIENDDFANNTDPQGFKGTPFTPDFQMIVAEDGTSRVAGSINTDATPYYFYVDLE